MKKKKKYIKPIAELITIESDDFINCSCYSKSHNLSCAKEIDNSIWLEEY